MPFKKEYISLFFVLLLVLCLDVIIQVKFFVGGTSRMFDYPTNDAARWVMQAADLLNGLKINPRPLFLSFLSVLIFFFKSNFLGVLLSFAIIRAFALTVSFHALKDIKEPVFVVMFLSLFSAWLCGHFSTVIMTENLAQPILLIGISFFLKGLINKNSRALLLGVFYMILVQMIRPWDVFLIFVLPFSLYCFLRSKKIAIMSVVSEFLAITVFVFGVWIFCNPAIINMMGTATKAFYHQTAEKDNPNVMLSWKNNEDILSEISSGKDAEPAVIARHSIKNIISNHVFFMEKAWSSFYNNISSLSRMNIAFYKFLIFLFLFSLFLFKKVFYDMGNKAIVFLKENWKKTVFCLSFLLPVLVLSRASFFVFFAGGSVLAFVFGKKGVRCFVFVLMFSFILASVVFGEIGFRRYSLFPQALALFMYSMSVAMFVRFVFFGKIQCLQEQAFFEPEKKEYISVIKNTAFCYLIFLFMPFVTQNISHRETSVIPQRIKQGLDQKIASNDSCISGNELLVALEELNNEQIFEYNNKGIVKIFRYEDIMAKEFDAGEGLVFNDDDTTLCFRQFTTLPFKRTVFGMDSIIFPGMSKKDMAKWDGDEIVVSGTVVTFKRMSRRHIGAFIVAQKIGYFDNGKLVFEELDK